MSGKSEFIFVWSFKIWLSSWRDWTVVSFGALVVGLGIANIIIPRVIGVAIGGTGVTVTGAAVAVIYFPKI